MRVISMVPSWTETLLEAGVDVVGRTRFCIHPADKVKSIPAVGGTKDIKWEKVRDLAADLLILDREENPRTFAEESPIPWFATHVTDLPTAASGLRDLSARLANDRLRDYAERFEARVGAQAPEPPPAEWGDPTDRPVAYVIWKNPWMVAGPGTYIASVLRQQGYRLADVPGDTRYPEVTDDFLRENHPLFSSEPFPFATKRAELRAQFPRGTVVDGESYSWFGIRGLRFLEGSGGA